ncbi:uncharacterized protein OCT59_007560 [Rhizophagus irregularis]|uniref:Uncharacterized protein n=3 Tax=Rhizophagus irregularis TaxID=588596 RepID=A0A2I1F6S2_9GLOM
MDKASRTEKKCSECDNPSKGKSNLCLICTTRHIQVKIDEFIKYTQTSAHKVEQAVQWVDWKELSDIEKIGEGGFGSVYSSCWSKDISFMRKKVGKKKRRRVIKSEREIIALKTIGSPDLSMDNFLKEAEALFDCYNQENSGFCIKGLTQDPISMQYYIVTEYAENGDLRKYLHVNPNLSWENRLYIVWDISLDLERIHKAGLIHRDIHAGNILHSGKFVHLEEGKEVHEGVAYISDFGYSMAASYPHNNKENIYGVMPYIAPEVFNGMGYSMKSDIYSIGIIMWELASGKQPFANISHDADLVLKIYDGLRPEPTPNAPLFYLELMQSCWHKDPSKRPKAEEIGDMIEKQMEIGLDKEKMQFIEAEEKQKTASNKIDPNAIYTSRLIPTITSLLSKRNSF